MMCLYPKTDLGFDNNSILIYTEIMHILSYQIIRIHIRSTYLEPLLSHFFDSRNLPKRIVIEISVLICNYNFMHL